MFSWRRTTGSSPTGQGDRVHTFHHLLDCARRGDSEALSVLYREFLSGVFGYIAARVPNRTTAEDLTSEVFLKVVEASASCGQKMKPGLRPGFFRSRALPSLVIIVSASNSQSLF